MTTSDLHPDYAKIPPSRFTDFLNDSEEFVRDGHSLKQQRLMLLLEKVYWAGRLDEREGK